MDLIDFRPINRFSTPSVSRRGQSVLENSPTGYTTFDTGESLPHFCGTRSSSSFVPGACSAATFLHSNRHARIRTLKVLSVDVPVTTSARNPEQVPTSIGKVRSRIGSLKWRNRSRHRQQHALARHGRTPVPAGIQCRRRDAGRAGRRSACRFPFGFARVLRCARRAVDGGSRLQCR